MKAQNDFYNQIGQFLVDEMEKIKAKEIKSCNIEYFNRFHKSEPEIQKFCSIKINKVTL